jgi:hypothetical protein
MSDFACYHDVFRARDHVAAMTGTTGFTAVSTLTVAACDRIGAAFVSYGPAQATPCKYGSHGDFSLFFDSDLQFESDLR